MRDTTNESLYAAYARHINAAYPAYLKRLGLDARGAKAEGALIMDSEGRTYIDCSAGYGLFNLGHNHPGVVQAVADQLGTGQPFNKPFIAERQVELAGKLSEISPGDLACSFICNSGSEAVDSALESGSFDLIVMDVMLPGRDGVQATRKLRKAGNETPVLMVTAKNQDKDKVLGLDAGADDYLTKPFSIEEFLARVRALLKRSIAPPAPGKKKK